MTLDDSGVGWRTLRYVWVLRVRIFGLVRRIGLLLISFHPHFLIPSPCYVRFVKKKQLQTSVQSLHDCILRGESDDFRMLNYCTHCDSIHTLKLFIQFLHVVRFPVVRLRLITHSTGRKTVTTNKLNKFEYKHLTYQRRNNGNTQQVTAWGLQKAKHTHTRIDNKKPTHKQITQHNTTNDDN